MNVYVALGVKSFRPGILQMTFRTLQGGPWKKRSGPPYHAEAMEMFERIKHPRLLEEPSQIPCLLNFFCTEPHTLAMINAPSY